MKKLRKGNRVKIKHTLYNTMQIYGIVEEINGRSIIIKKFDTLNPLSIMTLIRKVEKVKSIALRVTSQKFNKTIINKQIEISKKLYDKIINNNIELITIYKNSNLKMICSIEQCFWECTDKTHYYLKIKHQQIF